jgi:hypothetical protein
MPEHLSVPEVGKEIGEHAKHAGNGAGQRFQARIRLVSIIEAVLLSIVAVTAAWSGYSAAKWGTESSLKLTKATATRTKANRAYQQALTLRSQDAANFNAWFAAYLSGNKNNERVAERRFRHQYDVAFRAWLATKPFTNPHAPKGPQFMPQYHPTGARVSRVLDARADAFYAKGQHAGITGDKFIRVTVILASILFPVGISSQFPFVAVRIGLVAVGAALLVYAAVSLLQLPGPPT